MVKDYGLEYAGVATGKIRRYFSWENAIDILKVPVGTVQALRVLRRFKPAVIFSKGGYVSVPVVLAGAVLRIPVVCHESDLTPGLATKIAARFCKKILLSFEESKKFFDKKKAVVVGTPIRKELGEGRKAEAIEFTGLGKTGREVLLVMGGSQGALQINNLVDKHLDQLLETFEIIHVRGPGNLKMGFKKQGYRQYEYLNEEMKDIYALADIVVTRGGANSLAELGFLEKKAVIIPLSQAASRGDQEDNAKSYSRKFGWPVLDGRIRDEDFLDAIDLMNKGAINHHKVKNANEEIVKILLKEAR